MENRLLTVAKERVMDELEASLQRHPRYKNIQVYHKFHTLKERQQAGVILRGASAAREKMSADDCIGEMQSLCYVANLSGYPGNSIEWAWEDKEHTTTLHDFEDVTSYLQTDRRTLVFPAGTVITAGWCNPDPAYNMAQVSAKVNGVPVTVSMVDGLATKVVLDLSVPTGGTVLLRYYTLAIDIPGYYFIEMMTESSFIVTPLHIVEDEVLINETTGSETTVTFASHPVNLSAPLYLYTKKYETSNKILLDIGIDYTVNVAGVVTFLQPLKAGTRLFASYRWQGATRGPFQLGDVNEVNSWEDQSNSTAIKGVVLAFGTRTTTGDKQVVLLNKKRTPMARVMGGHYNMQFDIMAYTRDPLSLSEVVDHLVSDVWGSRRQGMIGEGYSITDMDPSGEAEENYDDAAGIMYFQHSISLSMITEWKKFEPYMTTVRKVNITLHRYPEVKSMEMTEQGMPETYTLMPFGKGFEVVYPVAGFPRI